MAQVTNYSPTDVLVQHGTNRLSGFGDGDFVTITKREDGITVIEGADGDATISHNPSSTYNVDITLMEGSSSNDAMSIAYNAQTIAKGRISVPLTVRDTGGRDVFISEASWIVKPADMTKSKEAGMRTWSLVAFNGQQFNGGL
jgi:hypothetical protein